MAVPRDEENRRPPPGGSNLEGMKRPAPHDGSNEDEGNLALHENDEIGGVIRVRLPVG